MKFGSLFSGIGGADLAAVAVGWEHKFWCEIDPFCQKVLRYWFNESEGYGDIKESDFSKWKGRIDVLHGSIPCQAVSISGKRRGDKDDRWLWKEMLRAIREIRPKWISFENVANLRTMVSSTPASYVEDGLCYEGKEGLLYGIIRDFEAEGYSVEIFVIPACAVGAPHLRKRIWIVGHLADAGIERCHDGGDNLGEGQIYTEYEWDIEEGERERGKRKHRFGEDGSNGASSHPGNPRVEVLCKREAAFSPEGTSPYATGEQGERFGLEQPEDCGKGQREFGGICGENGDRWRDEGFWEEFPAQSPVCRGNDGIPFDVDSLAIPFKKWREESVKAYGNALVPQVLYQLFKAINDTINLK